MTPEQIEQERTAFEAWYIKYGNYTEQDKCLYLCRNPNTNMYTIPHIQGLWHGWLAHAKQTGWISVEDRLPQCECRIYLDIVYIDKEGERTISEGLYVPNFGFSFVKPTVRGGELDWEECEINTVTHWKYSDTLPPLPEGA